MNPRLAVLLVAAVLGLSIGDGLLRMPIQRFDALRDLVVAQTSPSIWATLRDNLGGDNSTGGSSLLRPIKFVQIKALFDLSRGNAWLAFRGYHAVLLLAAVLLFAVALRVRTWQDAAAGCFALTVFTGIHTFAGTVREAFPVNHTLAVVVCCLIVINLLRSPGGRLADATAVLTFLAAALTLESGLLVWVIVVTAWVLGFRGVSSRGVLVMTALLGAYLVTRFFVLSVTYPGLSERSAGFLFDVLEGDELARRFGDRTYVFYAYNVGASMLSVLFAEPQSGVLLFARGWLAGDVPPRMYIAVISSTMLTVTMIWAALAHFRRPPDRNGPETRWFALLPVVLLANAVISFAYTKDEIMAPASVVYALGAYTAVRLALDVFERTPRRLVSALLCVWLCALAVPWAFRSAGVHHILRVNAFKQRNDWARLELPPASRVDASAELTRKLYRDALAMPVPTPDLLSPWTDRWWGD